MGTVLKSGKTPINLQLLCYPLAFATELKTPVVPHLRWSAGTYATTHGGLNATRAPMNKENLWGRTDNL